MNMFPDHEARKQQMRERGRGDIIDAHAHSTRHGEELAQSQQASCFYCCTVFNPAEISDWIDESGGELGDTAQSDSTALCPKCGIDSVIGDASGFPVTDMRFLKEMHGFWFS